MPWAGWVKPEALASTKRNSCYRRLKRQEERETQTLEYRRKAVRAKYRIRFHRYQKRYGYDEAEEVRNRAECEQELRMLEADHALHTSDTSAAAAEMIDTASTDKAPTEGVSSVGAEKRKRAQNHLGRFVSTKTPFDIREPDAGNLQNWASEAQTLDINGFCYPKSPPLPPEHQGFYHGDVANLNPVKLEVNWEEDQGTGWMMEDTVPAFEVPIDPAYVAPKIEGEQSWLQDFANNFSGEWNPQWHMGDTDPATETQGDIVYYNMEGVDAPAASALDETNEFFDDELPPADMDVGMSEMLLSAIAAMDTKEDFVNATDSGGNPVTYSVEDTLWPLSD